MQKTKSFNLKKVLYT